MPLRAPAFWLRPPGIVAHLLSPVGAIYGAATAHRMARAGAEVGAPVICVGNLTLGGAGKTPTVIALANILKEQGRRPFVVSRGYGGTTMGPLRVDPQSHDAALVGDEPIEIAPIAPVIVSRDRVAGATMAVAGGGDVILLDDGLQNPSLRKTFSFAVVDGEVWFGNGLCFPAGPLRAPVTSQRPHIDALIVIGGGDAPRNVARILEGLPVLRARFAPSPEVKALSGRRVLAFAGIGRPQKFFDMLRAQGARVEAAQSFADHRPYSDDELGRIAARAAKADLVPVTTMKDLARIGAERAQRLFAGALRTAPVALEFDEPETIRALLKRAVQN
ncbi:tetraacyldisaccharide 4'-kinase [Terrarubrum flagellatum]|uniref:tetraacyldisaccharide 4'-kinase n=1 Tax=Terrirubrum flagellatum TaxID=2895980 RepID=UPI0031452DB7